MWQWNSIHWGNWYFPVSSDNLVFLNLELISISKEKLDAPMKNTYLTVTFNCCGKPTVLWMLVATGDEVSLAGHSSQYYVIVSV